MPSPNSIVSCSKQYFKVLKPMGAFIKTSEFHGKHRPFYGSYGDWSTSFRAVEREGDIDRRHFVFDSWNCRCGIRFLKRWSKKIIASLIGLSMMGSVALANNFRENERSGNWFPLARSRIETERLVERSPYLKTTNGKYKDEKTTFSNKQIFEYSNKKYVIYLVNYKDKKFKVVLVELNDGGNKLVDEMEVVL